MKRGYSGVNMKGKLTRRLGCGCCIAYNMRKLDLYKKKNYLKISQIYMPGYAYDGTDEYPPLIKLFGSDLEICADHPAGEEVLFLKGKYIGYADDWMRMLIFAEKSGYKYKDSDDLFQFYIDNVYANVE
jgi:hypothetical protein